MQHPLLDYHVNRLRTKAYSAIHRCTNEKSRAFKHYGDRGIKIYPPWLENPQLFILHLMSLPGCYNIHLMLDRRDSNGNYVPGNLRFVTPSISARNRRSSKEQTSDEAKYSFLSRDKNKRLAHLHNCEYVENACSQLRVIRGDKSQMYVACMADVVQSYISRVEAGSTYGIGPFALQRILDAYKEISSDHIRSSQIRPVYSS